MADVAKRLVGPVGLAATNTLLYTAPASTTTIVRNIHIFAYTGNIATAYVAIGTAATTSNWFYGGIGVPSYGALDWSGFLVLGAGETLYGYASAAGSLNIVISGVEVAP